MSCTRQQQADRDTSSTSRQTEMHQAPGKHGAAARKGVQRTSTQRDTTSTQRDTEAPACKQPTLQAPEAPACELPTAWPAHPLYTSMVQLCVHASAAARARATPTMGSAVASAAPAWSKQAPCATPALPSLAGGHRCAAQHRQAAQHGGLAPHTRVVARVVAAPYAAEAPGPKAGRLLLGRRAGASGGAGRGGWVGSERGKGAGRGKAGGRLRGARRSKERRGGAGRGEAGGRGVAHICALQG